MFTWIFIIVCVVFAILMRIFEKTHEKPVMNHHIFDGETGQRVSDWKYVSDEDEFEDM